LNQFTTAELLYSDAAIVSRPKTIVKWIAIGFAALTLVGVTALFAGAAWWHTASHVRVQAVRAADEIADIYRHDSAGWMHHGNELHAILGEKHEFAPGGWHEIVGPLGNVILPSHDRSRPKLAIFGEATIATSGQIVGFVRIAEDIDVVAFAGAAGLLLASLLSGSVLLTLWTLPMRALDRALERVAAYREALEDRVTELEISRDQLERQGMDLSQTADNLFFAREMERQANKAKSEFLAHMSHELRTPLNSIIGFSEMMTGEFLGPVGNQRYREYAGHIEASGNHLLQLINDILDLAKVEAGHLELDEELVDFGKLTESCRTLLAPRIQAGGLVCAVSLPNSLPSLHADPRKMKQILLNLMTNAIKHTPPGGTVRIHATADATNGFTFSVTDTGSGMAPEDIPRALEPFRQLDNPLTRSREGTGLGLPLTKALAELHGGSLELRSALGEGTTAVIHLPAERMVPAVAVQRRSAKV